jgi:hypothetical protein
VQRVTCPLANVMPPSMLDALRMGILFPPAGEVGYVRMKEYQLYCTASGSWSCQVCVVCCDESFVIPLREVKESSTRMRPVTKCQ